MEKGDIRYLKCLAKRYPTIAETVLICSQF